MSSGLVTILECDLERAERENAKLRQQATGPVGGTKLYRIFRGDLGRLERAEAAREKHEALAGDDSEEAIRLRLEALHDEAVALQSTDSVPLAAFAELRINECCRMEGILRRSLEPAKDVELTKAQLKELRLLADKPQRTYGKGRARVQNNLVALGLAGPASWKADKCFITKAGREWLEANG